MGIIKLLDNDSIGKIAAGEVVENAASVVKELIENAADAGAKRITVEIKDGGKSYIRVTDDGCGMSFEDSLTAFERHATSKIRSTEDLIYLETMGFRGEALAALAAVAKVSLFTKRPEDGYGSETVIEGGTLRKHEQSGQKDGTTVIVKDLFFNTPARLKFLKRDATEAQYVSTIVEREAVSRPDISFTFIKDGDEKFFTDGAGNLAVTLSSIYGSAFASTLLPVKTDDGGVLVKGFIGKPLSAKATRDMQLFFVNGRYIKSRQLSAALESGYANELMTQRFPTCVLFIEVSPSEIDVNVSPAKTEVKFSSYVPVTDSVYFAVKEALAKESGREEIIPTAPKPKNEFESLMDSVSSFISDGKRLKAGSPVEAATAKLPGKGVYPSPIFKEEKKEETASAPETEKTVFTEINDWQIEPSDKKEKPEIKKLDESFLFGVEENQSSFDIKTDPVSVREGKIELDGITVIGEAWNSYIIVEKDDELYIIDKHAAHERILFEKLKSGDTRLSAQLLMIPEEIPLSPERAGLLKENPKCVADFGFECDVKDGTAFVKAVPSLISQDETEEVLCDALDIIAGGMDKDLPIADKIYHTIACKAAIKAGMKTSNEDTVSLVKELFERPEIRYCPHGRPVMTVIKKSSLENRFER